MLTYYILTTAVALAVGTTAQSTTPSAPPTTTSSSSSPSGSVRYIDIAVGADLHKFTPDNVTANVGDIIRFGFYPAGHRVARAEFKSPCIPYENTGANKRGFWSGVISPQVIQNPPPYYEVRVNDTDPIFFYCGAPGSCKNYGMVGVINPTREQTLEIQKEFARNSTLQMVPGDPWPSETLPATPTPTQTSSSNPNSGSSGQNGATPSADPQAAPSGNSSLGAGAIAGIAIGSAAVLLLGAGLVYMCGRRGGFGEAYRKNLQAGGVPPGVYPNGMVEAKHGVHDPKSPGQATLSTFAERDPYRASAQSAAHPGHFSGTPPPPISPGMPGYGAYQSPTVPNGGYHHHPPSMNEVHTTYTGSHSPAPVVSPNSHVQSPIELPTSNQPIPSHSPPPGYQNERRDSWTMGQEGAFRSSKP